MRKALLLPALCFFAALAVTAPVRAQSKAGAPDASAATPQTEEQKKAQEHFQRAKELYQAGKYSETIAELEVARGLDPHAKDLVMNLGIVHEKLGAYDEAIAALKSFLEMDGVTAAERTKVEGMIKRIEGAKSAAPSQPSTAAPPPTTAPVAEAPPAPAPSTAKGRLDGLTIAAGTVAAVGLVAGTSLGVYALSTRPSSDFVTGRDGSYATLKDQTNTAHTVAIVADVSFGISAVAALATAWLYFGRPKVVSTSTAQHVSFTPILGAVSGASLGGTF